MPPPMAAYDPLRRRENVDEDTAADAERIDTGTAIEVGAFPDEARASPHPQRVFLELLRAMPRTAIAHGVDDERSRTAQDNFARATLISGNHAAEQDCPGEQPDIE